MGIYIYNTGNMKPNNTGDSIKVFIRVRPFNSK